MNKKTNKKNNTKAYADLKIKLNKTRKQLRAALKLLDLIDPRLGDKKLNIKFEAWLRKEGRQ